MFQVSTKQVGIGITLTACIAIGTLLVKAAIGQEGETPPADAKPPQAVSEPAPTNPTPEKPKTKRVFKGRLPIYYNEVVDPKQRKAIYAIQIEYEPRIQALKDQLVALIKERNAKVEAQITPKQLAEVEAFRAAAKAKRAKAKAESQPPTPEPIKSDPE